MTCLLETGHPEDLTECLRPDLVNLVNKVMEGTVIEGVQDQDNETTMKEDHNFFIDRCMNGLFESQIYQCNICDNNLVATKVITKKHEGRVHCETAIEKRTTFRYMILTLWRSRIWLIACCPSPYFIR